MRISWEEQLGFAELSGDHNPLHVDPLTARRLIFGEVVVHGVHLVCAAIEAFLRSRPVGLRRLEVQFREPAFVGDALTLHVSALDPERAELLLCRGEANIARLVLTLGAAPPPLQALVGAGQATQVRDRPFAELDKARGALPLWLDTDAAARRFPRLLEILGPARLASLLGTTRLVGTECPGLHSLFAGFALDLGSAGGERLEYEVLRAATPRAPIRMRVAGPGLSGQVEAFYRPAFVEQPGLAELEKLVTPGEFAGQRALVVGGSRGLGEAAMKLVLAGGGEAAITYHVGDADARRLREDARRSGKQLRTLPLDVLAPSDLAPLADFGLTHLYYFASPRITRPRAAAYDPDVFAAFVRYYVDGFFRLCTTLKPLAPRGLRVFYPSTILASDPGSTELEYVMAKLAGEALCAALGRQPGFVVLAPRLPKVRTDQTVTLLPNAAPDAASVLLPLLREIAGRALEETS